MEVLDTLSHWAVTWHPYEIRSERHIPNEARAIT